MKRAFLLIVAVLLAEPSQACCGTIGKFVGGFGEAVADAGKVFDRKRRQLQKAANDVGTFGHSVAERKKAKAAADEKMARQRRDQTAIQLAEKINAQKELRVRLVAEKRSADVMVSYVKFIKATNATGVATMKLLFDDIRTNRVRMEQKQIILTNQRNDIYRFVESLGLDELPEKARINATIKRQLEAYDNQLKNFPGKEIPQQRVEAWFNELADNYTQIGLTIDRLSIWLEAEQTRIANDIKQLDAVIITLQGVKK